MDEVGQTGVTYITSGVPLPSVGSCLDVDILSLLNLLQYCFVV